MSSQVVEAVHSPPRGFWSRRKLSLLSALLLLLVAVDACWIEPNWIEVTRHNVKASLQAPLEIAHLTDLHTLGLGYRERKLLEILETEKPDVIVITGDMIANSGSYEMTAPLLSRLKAPLGVWAVRGNWEWIRRKPDDVEFLQSVGVRLLVNGAQPIREDVWLMGFDDLARGTPTLEPLSSVPSDAFAIALFHEPLFFEEVAGRCTVALAGHTHGGQIRLPWMKPFFLPSGCGPFVEGWYEQAGSRMYVSRGIGTSIASIRFLCRPEVALVTVGK